MKQENSLFKGHWIKPDNLSIVEIVDEEIIWDRDYVTLYDQFVKVLVYPVYSDISQSELLYIKIRVIEQTNQYKTIIAETRIHINDLSLNTIDKHISQIVDFNPIKNKITFNLTKNEIIFIFDKFIEFRGRITTIDHIK